MLFMLWIFNDMIYRPYIVRETEVSYNQFLDYLNEKKVAQVTLGADRFAFTLKEEAGNRSSTTSCASTTPISPIA